MCPEFIVLNICIFLIIQNFEQLAHALKNKVCPEIFHCFEIFLSFRIFEQLALALKIRVALKIFTVFKYFLSFRIFGQLALALKKRVCPENFQARGGGRPPASYAYDYTHMLTKAMH